MDSLLSFDRDHIWHPYTSMVDPLPCYVAKSASGVVIELADDRAVIDGMASWWCAIHGYNHPVLNGALQEQSQRLAHVMFGGLTHEPAVQLAKTLIAVSPSQLQRVFFADSGSVAVEVALKMAIQYWQALGKPKKTKMATVRGGYHGDTFGAMGVCDPVTGMHRLFEDVLAQQLFLPRPETRFGESLPTSECDELERVLAQHQDEVAALILEPIVQGAGGMWFYSAEYVNRARQICNELEVLLIFDEIATGFGRTGEFFATDHTEIEPDIMCVGKAMTGGYLTLSATLTTRQVAEGISADGGVLMHGPTFMANPLACAVANASINLLLDTDWFSAVKRIESKLQSRMLPLAAHAAVTDVRVLGAIGVVQTETAVDVAAMQEAYVKAGVWIRPFNDLIYLMPAYITDDEQLDSLCDAIEANLPPV